MIFNSILIYITLPVLVLIYWLLPNKKRPGYLLLTSYIVYGIVDLRYLITIMLVTFVSFIYSYMILKCEKSKKKKQIFVTSIFVILAILFICKYLNPTLSFIHEALKTVGIESELKQFKTIMAVGVSFYALQAISYISSVYKDKNNFEKNLYHYALYLSYFPKLAQGPITKPSDFFEEIKKDKKINMQIIFDSVLLIAWGLFLKIVIADRIGIFVDRAFDGNGEFQGWYLIIATIFYAFQIYCDFAGYSTIAIGTSNLFGITLPENFRQPYLATSVVDFWRRWHITLSNWFKEYIYIPLGGNRKGNVRKYVNLLIVFLVSGIWHGSAMTFVIWGILNGVYQVIELNLKPLWSTLARKLKINTESVIYKAICIIFTFVLISISWIFFRSSSLFVATKIIETILTANNFEIIFNGDIAKCGLEISNLVVAIIGIIISIAVDICNSKGIYIRKIIEKQNWLVKMFFIVLVFCVIIIFGKYGPALDKASFIYENF